MKTLAIAFLSTVLALPLLAQKDAEARLKAATEALNEMMNASDKGIPQDLISRASCVVVVPNQKAGGFIVGGQYGKGFFTCRKASGVGWSAPGALRISGGKFGFLIGGKETDVIMLVMNETGMQHLLSSHFKIGGEAA
ncbi:MAG: lipid-binding SYLF domain-containing protein, partial [Bryobacteraceae bacterium]